jgi:tetratricopeptide (TPR) repeat protein
MEAAMLGRVAALAGAALVFAFAGEAKAAILVFGGLAGACSDRARAGRNDPDSRDICSRAIASEPLNVHDRAGTYVNRGAMELGARLYEDAHSDFQAAIRLLPSLGEAHVGEGAYLVNQERFADAEAEISRGINFGSEEPEKAYYFRAIARWGQDDFKGAYEDFNKAIALKPGWSLPREQLKNFKVETAR